MITIATAIVSIIVSCARWGGEQKNMSRRWTTVKEVIMDCDVDKSSQNNESHELLLQEAGRRE